jgi:hypothetical protein
MPHKEVFFQDLSLYFILKPLLDKSDIIFNFTKEETYLLKKSIVISVLVIVCISIFTIQAGTIVQDLINMENKAYSNHNKSIVIFTHKKHSEEYKVNCGECHHDEKNNPLKNLKIGDSVQNCIECHKIPGEKPKGKDSPKQTRSQELAYHAEALHGNCRGCHKSHNKEKNLKTKDSGFAPITCKDCHKD